MLRKIFAAAAICIASVDLANAQNLPNHDSVCVSGIVSKKKLALYLLKSNPDWMDLALKVDRPASSAIYEPQWRKIFTDPKFCVNDTSCNLIDPAKKKSENKRDDLDTLQDIQFAFVNFVITGADSGAYSPTSQNLTAAQYFLGSDSANKIICQTKTDIAAPFKPPIDKSNIRIRGNADDLYLDRNGDKTAFKTTAPASGSITEDHSGAKTVTTKVQASIGYGIPIELNDTAIYHSLYATVVPYFSVNQSVTDTEGKSRTLAASNNVAVGLLDTALIHFNGDFPANHQITFKPQYLWNTYDHSEIASLKFIWAPWTLFGPAVGHPTIDLNSAFPISFLPGRVYGRVLFDVRNDTGIYTNRGDNPATAVSKTSYGRIGSKFGIGLTTTDPAFLPLTLLLTETYLYGYFGDMRKLDLFEASLTYALDPNGYFNLKAGYQNGHNEDTAAIVQGWTIGLSARY